jgi:hypothetical protein
LRKSQRLGEFARRFVQRDCRLDQFPVNLASIRYLLAGLRA